MFHDDDIVPQIEEKQWPQIEREAKEMRKSIEGEGLVTEVTAPRLWEDARPCPAGTSGVRLGTVYSGSEFFSIHERLGVGHADQSCQRTGRTRACRRAGPCVSRWTRHRVGRCHRIPRRAARPVRCAVGCGGYGPGGGDRRTRPRRQWRACGQRRRTILRLGHRRRAPRRDRCRLADHGLGPERRPLCLLTRRRGGRGGRRGLAQGAAGDPRAGLVRAGDRMPDGPYHLSRRGPAGGVAACRP